MQTIKNFLQNSRIPPRPSGRLCYSWEHYETTRLRDYDTNYSLLPDSDQMKNKTVPDPTFRLVAQMPTSSRISPAFVTSGEAKSFGRAKWAAIKRCRATRVAVVDSQGTCDVLWVAPRQASEVPTGHYAVSGKRYKIARSTKGKWAGWTFVQTGSEYHDAKTIASARPDDSISRDHGVLRAILANPAKCAAEYGRITGVCYRCGKTLEDPQSILAGAGPVCRQKLAV